MESEVFDIVKFEKEKAIARFNRFRRVAKLWQIFQVLVVLGLFSWTSAAVPAVLRTASVYVVQFSTYLLNHHVVFLIGNAIIVLLFVLCRLSDGAGGGDLYVDYVKHSEAAAHQLSPPEDTSHWRSSLAEEEEKQIVVCASAASEEVAASPQGDDMAAAIEKATRQIKKFERTQSEKLKREIAVRPLQAELRRSATQSRRKREFSDAAEMERLSNEEFQRTVEAFIDKHWSKKETKQNQFEEFEKYQLMKRA